MSRPELARRLETRIDTIEALEASDIARLPPWPETVRIVSAFTLLARIDPRPVLHVMKQRIEHSGGGTVRTAHAPPAPRPKSKNPGARAPGRISALLARAHDGLQPFVPIGVRRTLGRPALALAGAAIAALLLLISGLPSRTGHGQASAADRDSLLGRMVGGLQAYMSPTRTNIIDGMMWIDSDDPGSRKGDKLRSANQ